MALNLPWRWLSGKPDEIRENFERLASRWPLQAGRDIGTGVPGTITGGDTAAEGTAATLSRSDHDHAFPVAVSTYTPAWTAATGNPTIGNGTITGRYIQLDKIVHVAINVVAGSTTTFGTGNYNLSLPVSAISGIRMTIGVYINDVGTQFYVGEGVINSGTTFETIAVGSSATGPTFWSPTTPFTFGNADTFVVSGTYFAA